MTEVLHPEELITQVVFVRHGHTQQTEAGLLYNIDSADLTEKGVKQSEAAAEWLSGDTAEVLLSSPSVRTRTTASIVALKLEKALVVTPELTEQNIGEWEGRTYLDIKKNDPEIYRSWTADPVRNAPPQGESIAQMYERIELKLAAAIEPYAGKKVVLVTHAGVIRCALVAALGMPVDNFWRLVIPTGSISRIDYSPSFATVQYVAQRPAARS